MCCPRGHRANSRDCHPHARSQSFLRHNLIQEEGFFLAKLKSDIRCAIHSPFLTETLLLNQLLRWPSTFLLFQSCSSVTSVQEVSKEVEKEEEEVMKRRTMVGNCRFVFVRKGIFLHIFKKAGYWISSKDFCFKAWSFDPFDMHQVNQCEVTGHRQRTWHYAPILSHSCICLVTFEAQV